MRIAYLSGAYKNSGDFLIEKRALELIRYLYPEAEITRILRNEVVAHFSEINEQDCAVIGGGPIFSQSLEGYMPLAAYTANVKIPTMILGGGWYGFNGSSHAVRHYQFDKATKAFFESIYSSGFGFSCRDFQTVNALKANGFSQAVLTGCPAWYDVRCSNLCGFRKDIHEIQNIMVSDPARVYHLKGALEVVDLLKRKYPKAKITFLFHRGIEKDKHTLERNAKLLRACSQELEKKGISVQDISYGAEGFSLYDDCDLHVGYRVHAHIYNLSVRNRSVLIEEDGRGAGVNETLGLPSIRAYDDAINIANPDLIRLIKRIGGRPNVNLLSELETYLDTLQATDFAYLINAFSLQKRFFTYMVNFIKQLEKK